LTIKKLSIIIKKEMRKDNLNTLQKKLKKLLDKLDSQCYNINIKERLTTNSQKGSVIMADRITDRERFTKIAEVIPEYKEWAEKKIAAMDKRNEARKNAEKKPTKAQLESLALQPKVAELLTAEGVAPKAIAEELGVAFQRVTPILKRLVEAGEARVEKVKGDNLYFKVEVEE
jgi:hypothetical protein